jgi:uncharacterized protein (DUF58 family)
MRSIITLLAVVAVAAVGAASASATAGTGNQNPALAVSISIEPSTVTTGDVVSAAETVTNVSSSKQVVVVTTTITGPSGAVLATDSQKVVLKRGESFTQSASYVVDTDDERGVYTATVTATASGGTSSASASVEYV